MNSDGRSSSISRRGLLKGLGVAAGAAAGTRVLGGAERVAQAQPAGGAPALLIVHLLGGFNSIFVSADSLVGKFGVTGGGTPNFTKLPNGGPGIDNTWFSTLNGFHRNHFATIGVRHGQSAHNAAQLVDWMLDARRNRALVLAAEMGGNAAIRAASVGNDRPPGPKPPPQEKGISLQVVNDMEDALAALGGGKPGVRVPDRAIMAGGVARAQTMSMAHMNGSPEALATMRQGFEASLETLRKAPKTTNLAELLPAYGLQPGATAIGNNFAAKMAAAELMIANGTNVVAAIDRGWDTHGDRAGTTVRNKMRQYVMGTNADKKGLAVFLDRMVVDDSNPANADKPGFGRNVVVVVMGDFARSLPGSDHQPNLSVAVIGKFVKNGTTGRTDGNVGLPANAGNAQEMWSYLAAVTKSPSNPFGPNPHGLVL